MVSVGERVEARYDGRSKWYQGSITSKNPDGTVDITYDSGMWNGWEGVTEYGVKSGLYRSMNPSDEAPAPPADQSGKKKNSPSTLLPPPASAAAGGGGAVVVDAKFQVGQRVEARHKSSGSKWYGATVMSVGAGGAAFNVCYDGGMWNEWMPVTEPEVPAGDIRAFSGEGTAPAVTRRSSVAASVDHSPIRKSPEAVEAATTRSRFKKLANKVMGNNKAVTADKERLTRAQSAACKEKEEDEKSKEEVSAKAGKAEAGSAAVPSTPGRTAGSTSTSTKGSAGPLSSFRETKAMKAQREAAMKRREQLAADEVNKYGESFDDRVKTAQANAESKKHTFLKRSSFKAEKEGGGSSRGSAYTPAKSPKAGVSRTPSGFGGGKEKGDAQSSSSAASSSSSSSSSSARARSPVRGSTSSTGGGGAGGGGGQQLSRRDSIKGAAPITGSKKQLKSQSSSLGASLGSSLDSECGSDEASSSGSLSSSGSSSSKAAYTKAQLQRRGSVAAEGHGKTGGGGGGSGGGSHNNGKENVAPVRVVVRKRPPTEAEVDAIRCLQPMVVCYENKTKVDLTKYVHTHKFCFDNSFGEAHSTSDLYEQNVRCLMDNFVGGGASTCFCFGQTASGKTFTLFGAGGGQVETEDEGGSGGGGNGGGSGADPDAGGVYMLAARDCFARLQRMPDLCLSVSMFEIYGQKVRDLLADCKELAALEDGKGVLQLVGLAGEECHSISDFVRVSNVGRLARSTTATGANATSSRSHAAMLLRLVRRGGNHDPSKPKPSLGKFSLIDLAGSERGADNENTDKTTQMEGRQINQSLLALKEVIRAKELGRSHAPFRQSRLTQVLEESLTGRKCQTVVIGCISPNERDIQQTVNTLRYAEGLRPGLKKDMAKQEKAAVAREQAQAAEEAAEEAAAAQRIARQQERASHDHHSGGSGGDFGGSALAEQEKLLQRQASEGALKTSPLMGPQDGPGFGEGFDYEGGGDDDDDDGLLLRGSEATLLAEAGRNSCVTGSPALNLLDGLDEEANAAAGDAADAEAHGYGGGGGGEENGRGGVGRRGPPPPVGGEEARRSAEDGYDAYGGARGSTSSAGSMKRRGSKSEVKEMLRAEDKSEVERLLARTDRKLDKATVGGGGRRRSLAVNEAPKPSGGGGGGTGRGSKAAAAPSSSAALAGVPPPSKANTALNTSLRSSWEKTGGGGSSQRPSYLGKAPDKGGGGGGGGGGGLSAAAPAKQAASAVSSSKPQAARRASLAAAAPSSAPSASHRGSSSSSSAAGGEDDLRGSVSSVDSAAGQGSQAWLERRLAEREAELEERSREVAALTGRVSDLNRALGESDQLRADQTAALKRERATAREAQAAYEQGLEELEKALGEAVGERDEAEAELTLRETEVEQLCAEVEDREGRIDELKLMLKKMLETSAAIASPAPADGGSAPRATRSSALKKR